MHDALALRVFFLCFFLQHHLQVQQETREAVVEYVLGTVFFPPSCDDDRAALFCQVVRSMFAESGGSASNKANFASEPARTQTDEFCHLGVVLAVVAARRVAGGQAHCQQGSDNHGVHHCVVFFFGSV